MERKTIQSQRSSFDIRPKFIQLHHRQFQIGKETLVQLLPVVSIHTQGMHPFVIRQVRPCYLESRHKTIAPFDISMEIEIKLYRQIPANRMVVA